MLNLGGTTVKRPFKSIDLEGRFCFYHDVVNSNSQFVTKFERNNNMSALNLTFPDGAVKVFPDGTKPIEVAQSISKSLAKKSVSAKLNDAYVGMNDIIPESGNFQLITTSDTEALSLLRHATSHLLAQALKRMPKFANMHFGVGHFIMIPTMVQEIRFQ